MKIGYVRYLNHKKSDVLVKNMEKAEVDKIIFGISFQSNDQKKFKEFIETMDYGDILVIDTLNTLGESIYDIIDILDTLQNKQIGIQVLQIEQSTSEGVKLNNEDVQRLLKKYLIHALHSIDEKLKNDIRNRQSKGVINAKRKKVGRPKKYSKDAEDPYDREIYYAVVSMLEKNIPISDISNEFDLSRTTIYRIKDEMDEKNDRF